MRTRLLDPDFATSPAALAQRLIGAALCRKLGPDIIRATIVETEAYIGPDDKAAHSHANRRTPRTEPMFGPPGTSYVFLTYGMHHCFNVVCGQLNEPVAVLVRAAEIIEGLDRARAERAARSKAARPIQDHDLASGPAKLCQALAIDKSLNDIDLTTHDEIWIESGKNNVPLANGPRIGVQYAQEWANRPLRWWMVGSRAVSLGDGIRPIRDP